MATTAQQVYDITMSLIDERLESGAVDATSTVIFSKNAPFLLTSLQDELIEYGDYWKEKEITKAATTNDGGYEKYTMDADFQDVRQVVEITGDTRTMSEFKWVGKNELYVPDNFVGTILIKYYPIPTAITALTDSLVLDTITCRTTLAYGLASRLLTNENKVLANYFNDLYNELKNKRKKRKPAIQESIIDVYDTKNTY